MQLLEWNCSFNITKILLFYNIDKNIDWNTLIVKEFKIRVLLLSKNILSF